MGGEERNGAGAPALLPAEVARLLNLDVAARGPEDRRAALGAYAVR